MCIHKLRYLFTFIDLTREVATESLLFDVRSFELAQYTLDQPFAVAAASEASALTGGQVGAVCEKQNLRRLGRMMPVQRRLACRLLHIVCTVYKMRPVCWAWISKCGVRAAKETGERGAPARSRQGQKYIVSQLRGKFGSTRSFHGSIRNIMA